MRQRFEHTESFRIRELARQYRIGFTSANRWRPVLKDRFNRDYLVIPRAHRVSHWLQYSLLTLPGERFLTPLSAMQAITVYGHSHELSGLAALVPGSDEVVGVGLAQVERLLQGAGGE